MTHVSKFFSKFILLFLKLIYIKSFKASSMALVLTNTSEGIRLAIHKSARLRELT
jgi:hypothetical protein